MRRGRYRWVAELCLAWPHRNRRLPVSYERRADVHQGLLDLGCTLICWRPLTHDRPAHAEL